MRVLWRRCCGLSGLLGGKPYLILDRDCPPGNVYVDPTGRVVCHPESRRIGAKALADIEAERER